MSALRDLHVRLLSQRRTREVVQIVYHESETIISLDKSRIFDKPRGSSYQVSCAVYTPCKTASQHTLVSEFRINSDGGSDHITVKCRDQWHNVLPKQKYFP